ncbi:MAG TPA: pyridoxamine 5'-phosphate oxidase family protein [Candidatus Thermoplasmatota archaeon]|nr:pyridoxamine 5'-phosphate oxidase family protein [Candidatus Thermoplasmatota archaeon]
MREMTHEEVRAFITGNRFGYLGLADDGRAYVIPLFYAYDGRTFWFHANPGLKDEYIARTREACLTVVRAWSEDEWESVIASGPIRPVDFQEEAARAMDALMAVPMPPAYGVTEHGEPRRAGEPGFRFLKLEPEVITGRSSARPRNADADRIATRGM